MFKGNQDIVFGNANVIVGVNEVGKTAICEWLWTLKDSSTLWRWGAYPNRPGFTYHDVKIAIDLRAPARQHIELEITRGRPTFTIDNQKFPFSPFGYETSSLSEVMRPSKIDKEDQVFIARCLNMDEISVQALADHISEKPGLFLKGACWKDERDDETDGGSKLIRSLYCELAKRSHMQPFKSLSGGEASAVLLDLAIARARILAAHRPTLLIVETGILMMSEVFLSQFLEELSSPQTPFQSGMAPT